MSMWTPHDIQVLLHHYCSPTPWPRGDTDAYRETIEKFRRLEVIDPGSGEVRITVRGKGLIHMWLRQPVPLVRYVDPRFADEALDDPEFQATGGLAL